MSGENRGGKSKSLVDGRSSGKVPNFKMTNSKVWEFKFESVKKATELLAVDHKVKYPTSKWLD